MFVDPLMGEFKIIEKNSLRAIKASILVKIKKMYTCKLTIAHSHELSIVSLGIDFIFELW
jgi:phosphotransferase system HPr-like phosphotransfer protein